MHLHNRLTNDELLLVVVKGVLWDFEVKRSGTSSNSTRDIVVGSVTRAEPSSVVTSLSDRDTTQVGAVGSVVRLGYLYSTGHLNSPDTKHDEPV
jgi:hypothetical protein